MTLFLRRMEYNNVGQGQPQQLAVLIYANLAAGF